LTLPTDLLLSTHSEHDDDGGDACMALLLARDFDTDPWPACRIQSTSVCLLVIRRRLVLLNEAAFWLTPTGETP